MIARALLALTLALLGAPAQDAPEFKVEKALAGYRFADGPAWSRDGHLVFCDVPSNRMIKWMPGQKPEIFRQDTGGACGSAFDAQGRLYVCEARARRVVRFDKQGKMEVLAEKWQGRRLNAPNDIAVRRDGQVYFTDPAFGIQSDTRELDFYGVYHLTPKGELEVVAKLRTRPNGVAISANGRTLYVVNSDERNVWAYDLDRAGAAANGRVVVANIEGVPGGIRIDEKNNLYVAARNLCVFSPEGHFIRQFELGEKPSNVAFGDADLQSLYITARTSVYRVRLNTKGAAQY